MVPLSEFVERGKIIYETITRTELTLIAGALAFFGLLSVVPLAVVIVGLAAAFGGSAIIEPIVQAFDHLITDEAVEIIRTGLDAEAGRSGATLAGIIFTILASTRVFRAMDRAFNTIYGEPGSSTIIDSAVNAGAVLLALVGVGLLVGVVLFILNQVGAIVPIAIIPFLVVPLLALLLFPMYSLFPPGPPRLLTAIPGAIIAAIGITVATAGLQLYIEIAAPFAVYGVLAGVFVVMLWLYILAIMLLLGAVVNATNLGAHRQLHVDRIA